MNPIQISKILTSLSWILVVSLLSLIIYYLINIGNNYVKDNRKIKFNKKKVIPLLILLLFLYLFVNLFRKYTVVSDTFYTIIISIILAYLFNPLINYFEKKGIKRLQGVLILYLIILAIILILAFLVIPRSTAEAKKLIRDMPSYIGRTSSIVDSLSKSYNETIGELPPIFTGIQEVISENIATIQKFIINGLKSFIFSIINIFSKVLSLVLTPILTLYFLVDKDYFKDRFKSLIPKERYNDTMELLKEIDKTLSMFVRGRIIMAAYVGIATTILLLSLRVDFAIAIGFITGISDIVPYIGPFLGFMPAVFFAFLSKPIKAVWVSLIFLLIQWTENNILAPKVIGDNTGLHPMVVLLSIILGGGIFGVPGMILAVPVVAVLIILYKYFKEKIRESLRD